LNKGALIFLVVILFASVSSILSAYFITVDNPSPENSTDDPSPSFPPIKTIPLIYTELDYITSPDLNLTQSGHFAVNINVSSRADKELVIPFSLELFSVFRDGVQEVSPVVSGFEYWYEPSFIVIEPNGCNSTLLTIEFFDISDIDRYDFRIKPGNVDEHHLGGHGLNIEVTSLDKSWIASIINLVEEYKPYPAANTTSGYPYGIFSHSKIYYYENGISDLVIAGDGRDYFISYLENLLHQVNVQRDDSISEIIIDDVLDTSKVLMLYHRVYDDFHLWENFDRALFVLESAFDEGLVGTIFIRQIIGGKHLWSQWMIVK